MPDCIVCDVPHYQGPTYFNCAGHPERATWLPFLPASYKDEQNYTVSRFQFPMVLAWALTIQKSQGMTLDKAILRCKQTWRPGMLFVGLSRVRHCMDLMLEDDFPALSQILKLRSQSGYRMRLRWEQKMRARFGHTVRMHMRDTTKYSAKRRSTVLNAAGVQRNLTLQIESCSG